MLIMYQAYVQQPERPYMGNFFINHENVFSSIKEKIISFCEFELMFFVHINLVPRSSIWINIALEEFKK